MSNLEQRAPRRRAIATLTSAKGRASTQASARGRALRRVGARGRASAQTGARGRVPVDPRVDGILQALETLVNVVGQQAQNQVTAIIDAATAATVATTAVANAAVVIAALAKVPPGNGNGEWHMHKLMEQFLKLKPPKFTGVCDPEAATMWIRELEKVFALLRCSEEDKVTLAVYQLQGNAST